MSSHGIASVDTYSTAIKNLLDRARDLKPTLGIEPALSASDFAGGIEEIGKLSDGPFIANSQAHYAAIETACRNIFYDLLVRPLLVLNSLRLTNRLRRRLRLMNWNLVRCGIYLTLFLYCQI